MRLWNTDPQNTDRSILRDLAERYAEITADPIMDQRRELWRDLHDLRPSRPPIHVRQYAFSELPQSKLECAEESNRSLEYALRDRIYAASLGDDTVFEPWISVRAVFEDTNWGVEVDRHFADGDEPGRLGDSARGAYKIDYAIKRIEDWRSVLRRVHHRIDEAKTSELVGRSEDAIGDIIRIDVNRAPHYMHWHGDLSSDLGKLRGIENFMVDMFDSPDELHRLMAFMRDGVLGAQQEAEDAGDWGASASLNQTSPYARGLTDPEANRYGIARSQLWGFFAAQEFTGVSPAMHDEFLLQYQLPIMRRFGLVAYGCCEDLTRKIDILRRIPNLRRIAVTPFADAGACARQIGTDYVISYRPSPADMVAYGFDEDRVRRILQRDLQLMRGCRYDVTLKDVQTVGGDPDRVRRWVALARKILEGAA